MSRECPNPKKAGRGRGGGNPREERKKPIDHANNDDDPWGTR